VTAPSLDQPSRNAHRVGWVRTEAGQNDGAISVSVCLRHGDSSGSSVVLIRQATALSVPEPEREESGTSRGVRPPPRDCEEMPLPAVDEAPVELPSTRVVATVSPRTSARAAAAV